MIKLNDDLKRILSGLAYQDAGEYLSTHEKMKLLGIEAEVHDATTPPTLKMVKKPASHRVALISDGRGHGAPLDYAIETCSRLGASIDLLIHSSVDTADITALEDRIRSTGLQGQTIRLGKKPVDDILNYIHSQPAIASIVAMPDDESAKLIMQSMASGGGESIPVPLVLIEDRASTQSTKQSAA
jgi:voltage-gated potassium channel Kch